MCNELNAFVGDQSTSTSVSINVYKAYWTKKNLDHTQWVYACHKLHTIHALNVNVLNGKYIPIEDKTRVSLVPAADSGTKYVNLLNYTYRYAFQLQSPRASNHRTKKSPRHKNVQIWPLFFSFDKTKDYFLFSLFTQKNKDALEYLNLTIVILYLFSSHELQTCDWPRNVGCLSGVSIVKEIEEDDPLLER